MYYGGSLVLVTDIEEKHYFVRTLIRNFVRTKYYFVATN